MNNMNSENKSSRYCDEQREAPPREAAQVLTEVIDDLKWSYAAVMEWHRGDPEELRDLDARYKEVLIRYNEYRNFYSDGTPIGAEHLDLEYEWIRYKAMEPPHRRCVSENSPCRGPQSHQDDGRRLEESESADERGVVW